MNTPDLTIASTRSVEKRVAANTGLMVGSKSLAAIIGLLSLLIAANSISIAALGIIFFLHSYHLLFAELATFQAWQPIIRFGMDDIKNDDADRLASLIKFGYKLDVISAVLAFLGAIAFYPVVIWARDVFPDFFKVLGEDFDVRGLYGTVILYCTLLLLRHRGASIGVFRLFDRFDVLAWHGMIMTVVRFIGVVIAWKIGAGMQGFLIAWFVGSFVDYLTLPLLAARELSKRNMLGRVLKAKASILKRRKGVWPFVWKANVDSSLAASRLSHCR